MNFDDVQMNLDQALQIELEQGMPMLTEQAYRDFRREYNVLMEAIDGILEVEELQPLWHDTAVLLVKMLLAQVREYSDNEYAVTSEASVKLTDIDKWLTTHNPKDANIIRHE